MNLINVLFHYKKIMCIFNSLISEDDLLFYDEEGGDKWL